MYFAINQFFLTHLCFPFCSKPTKVAYRYTEEGKKVRVSKSSGHIIAKPEPLADRKPRSVGMYIAFDLNFSIL